MRGKAGARYLLVLSEEDVLRLDVAVQHLAVVHVLHGQAELHKVVEDEVLRQQLAGSRRLLEQVVKVSALREVHDDVELAHL
jgi:hypothetical protein